MRDLLIFLIVFGSLPIIWTRPYVGVLVWSWLGYMNPHRLTWSFAYDFPFAQTVGIATLVALVFNKEKKYFPVTTLTVIWLIFIFWMTVSTVFSLNPDLAWEEWDRTMKIQLFSIVTVLLMRDRQRINYLVWVITCCIGFFGVKGGVFSILTGGNFHVLGPPGSFIEDNNAMGFAMVMVLPLMWYAYLTAKNRLIQLGVLGSMALTALAILTTHSRGAFLAIGSIFAFLWLKSRQKAWLGIILLVGIPVLWMTMPEQWHERMASILNYQEDGSAMGRINAWQFAINLAIDRPVVGGGFQTFTPELFQKFAPTPDDFHDSHSIYFEVLAEHGFVGLFLFLALGFAGLRTASRVIRFARHVPEMRWASDLASMLQVSLIGYAVGGAFLGLAYFDLYYHLIVLLILLRSLVENYEPAVQPADKIGSLEHQSIGKSI